MHERFNQHRQLIARTQTRRISGRVRGLTGLAVEAEGLPVSVGTICAIERSTGDGALGQVVAIDADHATLMTLEDPTGIAAGDRVTSVPGMQSVPVGRGMLGCVLDGIGRPIGDRRSFMVEAQYPIFSDPAPALARRPIVRTMPTGIRSIDALTAVGAGQRLGVFAGTGVGKSVLLGMIARNTAADVIVVALIGERGREVGDFMRTELGEDGMKRAVMVVSTSDESPVLRVRAAFVASAVAEYFRDLGNEVLLVMDSTTRMAMAQRQIGLSAGEPPTTKGYPPSAFALLPKLLERSGRTDRGSITGLYAVLVEGDDINEPVSDAIRGILDGHVWLSRDLANRGHYPAISILESISRVMPEVVSEEHMKAAKSVRRILALWKDIEDLVNIGAYSAGTNVAYDTAVILKPIIDRFLQQGIRDSMGHPETCRRLLELETEIDATEARLTKESQHRPLRKAS
jgi:flagellum-specific ATP synthase